MLSRSVCVRLSVPDGGEAPSVPSAIELANVTGPSTTGADPAVMLPSTDGGEVATRRRLIWSARMTTSPAPGGELELLSIVPRFVNVPPPPAIRVIAPPADATEEELATVRFAPPVVATVSALPFVVTPDSGFVAGPVMLPEEGIPVAPRSTPMVDAERVPMLRGWPSFR